MKTLTANKAASSDQSSVRPTPPKPGSLKTPPVALQTLQVG
jgi:hypothetical protein